MAPAGEMPFLQQFDRDPIGRFDKGHMPVARGSVNGMAGILQALARLVDILDPVGEMAEIASAIIGFRFAAVFGGPVMGQFDLREPLLTRRGKKDQREAPGGTSVTAHFLQPDQLEERDRRIRIGDADHGVEIFYHGNFHSKTVHRR